MVLDSSLTFAILRSRALCLPSAEFLYAGPDAK
jgi:hypothetical protein